MEKAKKTVALFGPNGELTPAHIQIMISIWSEYETDDAKNQIVRLKAILAEKLKSDVVNVMLEPCVCCGTKETVTFEPDPYLSDLRNDQTPVWMCEHCRELAAREL